MKEIPLTQDKVALVDDEDYLSLINHKWNAHKDNGGHLYVYSSTYINKKHGVMKMHRYILGLKKDDGKLTDHMNGNGLDNRKCNLRICTKSENNMNQAKTRGTSKYKGVSWCKNRKKWCAQIKLNQKQYFIGYFLLEIDAAMAYDKKAVELFGSFARLNFPL